MFLRATLAAALLTLSYPALADSVDINVSDDSVWFDYAYSYSSADFDVGLLYNEDDNWAVNAGMQAVGVQDTRSGRLETGLGGEFYGASVGDYEVMALALGGRLLFFPRRWRVGIGGYGFFAPDILTGLDGDRFWEGGLRLALKVTETSRVYVGYRKMRTRIEGAGYATIDKGSHIGLKISF